MIFNCDFCHITFSAYKNERPNKKHYCSKLCSVKGRIKEEYDKKYELTKSHAGSFTK